MIDEKFVKLGLSMLFGSLRSQGGIPLCIKCKKQGLDKYELESGEIIDICRHCVNNMTNYKGEENEQEQKASN